MTKRRVPLLFSRITLAALVVMTLGTSVFAHDCPEFEGVFNCKDDDPNYGTIVMKLSTRFIDKKSAEYTYDYYFPKQTDPKKQRMTLKFSASKKGRFNRKSKSYGICKNGAYYFARHPKDIPHQAAKNEILPNGDYQNTMPKSVYRCEATQLPEHLNLFSERQCNRELR